LTVRARSADQKRIRDVSGGGLHPIDRSIEVGKLIGRERDPFSGVEVDVNAVKVGGIDGIDSAAIPERHGQDQRARCF